MGRPTGSLHQSAVTLPDQMAAAWSPEPVQPTATTVPDSLIAMASTWPVGVAMRMRVQVIASADHQAAGRGPSDCSSDPPTMMPSANGSTAWNRARRTSAGTIPQAVPSVTATSDRGTAPRAASLLPTASAPPTPSADEQEFVDSVKLHQVTEADALQAIRTHGLNGARAIRDYALRQAARRKGTKEQVRDLGAYMARCFREGYGRWEEQDQLNLKRAETPQPEAQSARKAASEAERLAAKFKTAFRAHQNQLVEERLGRMSAEERARFDDEFAARHAIWARKFREMGPTTPLLRSAFQAFAVEMLLDAEQKDIVAFARTRSASDEVIQHLRDAV